MAKLTAMFEMRDRISKKMRILHGNLEVFDKRKRALEKPMVMKARDEATKKLMRFTRQTKRMPKKYVTTVEMADRFTKPAKGIEKYLKRKIPTTWAIAIEAKNKTKPVIDNIKRYLNRHLAKPRYLLIEAKDRATGVIHRISNYTRRSLAKGYNFSVRAIDIASKTVGRIASYTGRLIPKYRNFTIRAIDRATNVIGSVKKVLFSIPTAITVTLGVIGANKLKDSTVGAAMQFENYEVSLNHWLKGNKKQAKELTTWMGQFADKTPFSSPDLFPALARGIGLADGNIKQAKEMLKISTDMAALTPDLTVADAMEALGDAKMGEFERLKAFNMKVTQDSFKSMGGYKGLLKEAKKTFGGGAEALSETSYGVLQTLKGYKGSMMRTLGDGFLVPMKPRLDAISKWLENNQKAWGKWKDTLKRHGKNASEWIFSHLEKGFSYIRKHYLDNDAFMKLDFEGKVKFIMEDLGKWWDKTGRPWLADVSKDVGKAIFDGIVWGVKEGIKGIGSMWVDAFKDPSIGNFAGAGIATAIAASIGSLVLSPLIKGFRSIYRTGKWFYDMSKKAGGLFKKGKGPKPPTGTGGGTFRTPNNPTGRRSKPVYTQPWFNKGKKTTLNAPNKKPSTFSKIPKGLGKGLSTIGKFGKRIPVLGTVMGALSVLSAPKDKKSGAIGRFGGSLGGAATGAALGSVIPGVGTVVGGIAGAFGGEALLGWLGDNWETIKTKGAEAAASIGNSFNDTKQTISNTIFNSDWWNEKWEGVKVWTSEKWRNATELWDEIKTTISETLFSGDWWLEKWEGVKVFATSTFLNGDWWAEQGGKIFGFLEGTIFSGDWWLSMWETVKQWTAGTMFDPDWWGEKWESVKTWTAEKWDTAVVIWQGIRTTLSNTVFNGDWWLEKWEKVKSWTQDKWDSAVSIWKSIKTKLSDTVFNSDWWNKKWESVKTWTKDTWDTAETIWKSIRTTISNTLFDRDWWNKKWEKVSSWGQQIINDTGASFGKKLYNRMSSFNKGREKGKKAATYADGGYINRPHLGLVGEAGPEMIIPLSANRRSRAMDLYNQTGQMLGVRPYANGGLVGGTVKKPITQPVAASLNVGSFSVQGMDKEAKLYGESFTNAVASGINGNIVPITNWKKNNIENPMQGVIKQAVGFGSNTVTSFSAGQNATPTNTAAHLDRQVRAPFKVIQGGASQWGSGTVSGFRSGQNATSTGTKPYLVTNVHTPFNETRTKGLTWGSGTAGQFVSGMMSKSAQVKEAAKHLAKQVEKTFKEELGIHSPSRVMAQLGRFASLGIVKGLGAVDIKKFAEKQAGSLAAAFSGLGAVGGNVKQWIQAAMMITGVPGSWLGPLSVIAKKESGGNPRAINLWDINAKRGIPSKGLMQTIDPTFNAYKKKGMNDIWNPIHNVVAAINYIKSRYGSVFNVPGIKSMARGGAYRGYWKGTKGPLRSAETAWVGERGPELVHLPRGAEVYSHNESKRLADNQVSAAIGTSGNRSSSSPNKSIVVQITGDNHFNNDADMDNFTEKIKKVLEDVLRDEYNEGGELAVD